MKAFHLNVSKKKKFLKNSFIIILFIEKKGFIIFIYFQNCLGIN